MHPYKGRKVSLAVLSGYSCVVWLCCLVWQVDVRHYLKTVTVQRRCPFNPTVCFWWPYMGRIWVLVVMWIVFCLVVMTDALWQWRFWIWLVPYIVVPKHSHTQPYSQQIKSSLSLQLLLLFVRYVTDGMWLMRERPRRNMTSQVMHHLDHRPSQFGSIRPSQTSSGRHIQLIHRLIHYTVSQTSRHPYWFRLTQISKDPDWQIHTPIHSQTHPQIHQDSLTCFLTNTLTTLIIQELGQHFCDEFGLRWVDGIMGLEPN